MADALTNPLGIAAERTWHSVESKFADTLTRIRRRSQQIKEKANAIAQVQGNSQADLLKELDRLGLYPPRSPHPPTISSDDLIFPCSNIPFSRNPKFFGREMELRAITKHLNTTVITGSFRSFALYGTGGIGKTQTALAYAYEQKDNGTQAVLWFNCETGLSLARSFTDIASLLQLEGASEDEASEQNKILVLRWLRRTSTRSFSLLIISLSKIPLYPWPLTIHLISIDFLFDKAQPPTSSLLPEVARLLSVHIGRIRSMSA